MPNKGGRPAGPKTRCGGRFTEARFNSFIKSLLRQGTRRWAPITDVKKKGRTRRGFYHCDGCQQEVPATIIVNGKKTNNAVVDHVIPVVPPDVGFTTWDDVIERLFCEEEGLQLLCHDCHTTKSMEERSIAKERRAKEKEESRNDQS